MPPCQPWIDPDDVADCCGILAGSDNAEALTAAADSASAILFQLTGNRYTGTCERTVRPVGPDFCWAPRLTWRDRHSLSRVKLAGYVTAIVEVLIGPDLVDPLGYRIDDHRYLTRMAGADGNAQRWPVNPRLDLPIGEEGTFAITYEHGLQPPGAGVAAASSLACELYRACPAPGDTPGECRLPAGAKRIVRQGVTVEIVSALAAMLKTGATGLTAVDAFLAVYATTSRKSAIWSPDIRPFARPEGISSGS